MRRATAPLLLAAVLAAAPGAAAAQEPPPLAAELTACETAVAPEGRSAAFTGSMPALAGTERMAIRVDLLQRRAARGRLQRVDAPGLGEWQRSEPGRSGFVVTQRVERLAAPAAYRATIRFRWYAADGTVQRQTVRRTPVCRQPDPRPQLRVTAVTPVEGGFQATVANTGRSGADAFATALSIDGRALDTRRVEGLAAAEEAVLELAGPACAPGAVVRVRADAGGEVAEVDERDNVRSLVCPD